MCLSLYLCVLCVPLYFRTSKFVHPMSGFYSFFFVEELFDLCCHVSVVMDNVKKGMLTFEHRLGSFWKISRVFHPHVFITFYRLRLVCYERNFSFHLQRSH